MIKPQQCMMCNSIILIPSKGIKGRSIGKAKTFRYYKCGNCGREQCINI